MIDLSGRIAVVTGASRGIGRGIAKRLGERGALVLAAARHDHAADTAAEIVAAGGRAEAVSLDVSDREHVGVVIADLLARHQRVDVLVNNAGVSRDQLLLRMKPEDWDTVLSTNLTAAFTCTRGVLRTMVKQRWGRIINVGSVVGQSGNAGQANYAASKAGLIGFTKSLAHEVASRGITANVVAPGLIDTDMIRAMGQNVHQEWASRIPLGRLGTPDDVAAAVCFLASEEASYITGQVLGVNGGMYM